MHVEDAEVTFDGAGLAYARPYYNTQAQLFLTTINAGILRAILRDAVALVRRRERSFYYAPAERPADDPILQQTVGQIASNAFAAETVVLAAADALEAASAARDRGEPGGALDAGAALAAAKAKVVVVDELVIRSGGLLFDVWRRLGDQALHKSRSPLAQRPNIGLAKSEHLQSTRDWRLRDQRHPRLPPKGFF